MNNSDCKHVIPRNSKRTFVSAQLGIDEEHQTKKALVNALLSGQLMKGSNYSLTSNMLRLRNLGKQNVKKPKLNSRESAEIILSSSQNIHNLKDEVPLILHSNDEIQKLAESAKDDCTGDYGPVIPCEAVQKLTKTLVLHLNSVVNSTTGSEVSGTCVSNTGIAKTPFGERRDSADQVGILVDPTNSFIFDAVLFEENIGKVLTKGREITSNEPKVP